jgi:hypothetical protein
MVSVVTAWYGHAAPPIARPGVNAHTASPSGSQKLRLHFGNSLTLTRIRE